MSETQDTMTRLESYPRTKGWAPYIKRQATRVRFTIQELRRFADLKPGPVADHCNAQATALETRLEAVLNTLEV